MKKKMFSVVTTAFFALSGIAIFGEKAAASDLIYKPTNPSFGGTPLIDDYLFNSANIQNQFVERGGGGSGGGGVPSINFPPITIDLGGGNGGDPDPQDPNAQQPQVPAQQTTPPAN